MGNAQSCMLKTACEGGPDQAANVPTKKPDTSHSQPTVIVVKEAPRSKVQDSCTTEALLDAQQPSVPHFKMEDLIAIQIGLKYALPVEDVLRAQQEKVALKPNNSVPTKRYSQNSCSLAPGLPTVVEETEEEVEISQWGCLTMGYEALKKAEADACIDRVVLANPILQELERRDKRRCVVRNNLE